mmetsp:Transcript_35276/g.77066  ORF Transcript_35276/g.77066 Transcript_35276/m.77066 type:complete len:236 (-) Transcript_35276:54-761(-)
MAFGPPETRGKRTTGTTGIILSHKDCIMWEDRVRKESAARSLEAPVFQIRSGVRSPGIPLGPHQSSPTPEKVNASDPWDGDWELERNVAAARGKIGPRERCRFPESSSHDLGWSLSKTELSRSTSMPVYKCPVDTQYEQLRPALLDAAEKRARRRARKLAKVEAGIEGAMARSAPFLSNGHRGSVWSHSIKLTDISGFQDDFLRATGGIPLYKVNPKPDTVILRTLRGELCSPWK